MKNWESTGRTPEEIDLETAAQTGDEVEVDVRTATPAQIRNAESAMPFLPRIWILDDGETKQMVHMPKSLERWAREKAKGRDGGDRDD